MSEVRQTLLNDRKNACVNEIINNGPKAKDAQKILAQTTGIDEKSIDYLKEQGVLAGLKNVKLETIKDLPTEAKIETLAVKCHKKVEKNPEECLNFAKGQLAKYCDKQDVKVLRY